MLISELKMDFIHIQSSINPVSSIRKPLNNLLGALRLTTSGSRSQSRSLASLPPILLLIRSDYALENYEDIGSNKKRHI
jgi:hypothetical protein